MSGNASQISFRPLSGGFIEVVFTCRGREKIAEILAYPESGTMIGEPPRNEVYAARLNAAATTLNDKLQELSS